LLTPLNNAPTYQRQGAIHRRTDEAILSTTKSLIAQKGLTATTMIDISAESQVSRATLYNHYRDKNAVVSALLTSELNRLKELMTSIGAPAAVLEQISLEISGDKALEMMRLSDPTALAFALTDSANPLWQEFHAAILEITKLEICTSLAVAWLKSQVLAPITPQQSADEAALLVERTLF
jgi:AcrR family transcriptional regulator